MESMVNVNSILGFPFQLVELNKIKKEITMLDARRPLEYTVFQLKSY